MKRMIVLVIFGLLTAAFVLVYAAGPPQYGVQGSVSLAPSSPRLVAVDPYAHPANPSDPLKPARPYWYSVDKDGLTVLRISDNTVVEYIPWTYIPAGTTTQGIPVVQPDGEFVNVVPPAGGYQVVGMTVSYPTEEALASNSETPPTYVYVVVANSGFEWQSETSLPPGRDPGLRDKIVPATSSATESSMLIQVDVTDPTLPLNDPAAPVAPLAGAILGHGAGQPAYDPGTGSVYVGNMPSTSLPAGLQSFVSVITSIAPPEVAAAGEVGGAEAPPVILPLESPDVMPNTPLAWPFLVEGGDGPFVWEFSNLPSWLTAHTDKITGQLDGVVYGTVPASGSWTFQVRVTDYADPAAPNPSDWTSITMTANATAEEQLAGELPFEAGAPNAVAIQGTGSCTPGPTSSPGSIVPAWIEVLTIPGGVNPAKPDEPTIGCVIVGTAPVSGEYYEFTMPSFKLAYPWDREPVLLSGNVAGPYVFDPLPLGVTISGLAWHQIEKIHDPSTEADILNAEFFGVEPFTGQLYRILLPQGALEVSGAVGPPEISVETDAVSTYGTSTEVLAALRAARPDIAAGLDANPNLKVRFGDLVVEANPNPNVYVTAGQILDPTGANTTVIPIGGPVGSPIPIGALVKVSGTRDSQDPANVTVSAISPIEVPGVQAYSLGLDSDLSPGIPGSEPGQVDHGVLWVTGTNTGNVGVVDTALARYAQLLAVPGATSLGGVSIDFGVQSAYVAGLSSQKVTIFAPGASPNMAPVIWSASTATFTVGTAGSFKVIATGSPIPTLSHAGMLPPGVTFVDHGDGTATLAGTPIVAGKYSFTITAANTMPPDAVQNFTLTVNASGTPTAPVITAHPASLAVNVGQTATFTAAATGNPTPTLQWQQSTDNGSTWSNIPGATSASYTTPATTIAMNGYQYRAVFTNSVNSATTNPAILTVNAESIAPTVTTQPSSQTVMAGQAATFSAAANGNPTPTVQWQLSTDNGATWSNVTGATSTSYATPATTTAMSGYQYRAVFTNSVASATSNAAILTVNAAPAVTTHPSGQTVTAGETATFTSAATGSPTPTVQWQLSTNLGSSWSNIPGATSTSYTTPVTTMAMSGYQYRAVFTNSAGTTNSNAASLTVTPPVPPAVTAQPTNQTVSVGQTATFTAAASGKPMPTVQWQLSKLFGVGWTNIPGATGTSYTTPAATTAMNRYQYRAVFTNSAGTVTTSAAMLTVTAGTGTPVITAHPASQTVAAGQMATFTAAATGSPTPTVQWQLSTNGGSSWTSIPGGTSTSYTTAATTTAMNGYQYRAVFTNSGGSATTNAATLTVNAGSTAPTITMQPSSQAVPAGQTATFTATANGSPTPTVQWQMSTLFGFIWQNIPGATSTSYTTPATTTAMNGYRYRAVFTNSAGKATSSAAVLTVGP